MNLEKANEEAVHLSGMLMHPGWRIVEDEATIRMKALTAMLIAEDDAVKITQLQANIRGLQFLLNFPSDMLEVARRANAEASLTDEPTAQ